MRLMNILRGRKILRFFFILSCPIMLNCGFFGIFTEMFERKSKKGKRFYIRKLIAYIESFSHCRLSKSIKCRTNIMVKALAIRCNVKKLQNQINSVYKSL